MDRKTFQVAGVVMFYMSAALIVCLPIVSCVLDSHHDYQMVFVYNCYRTLFSMGWQLNRNKAVLNKTPDLPLLFLLVQLLIAVVLLHVTALLSPKIEIPTIDRNVAIKLLPVVSVNIIGLVFNTLCLRGVEASFFQVSVHPYSVICNPYFNSRFFISDCSRPRPSIDNLRILSTHPQDTDGQGHHRRCPRYVWFHSWYYSIK